MSKRILLALGGNALGKNLPEQMAAVHATGRAIVDLVKAGYEMVITHGNGPQVGLMSDAFESYQQSHGLEHFPMSVCVSLTQGYIGYDLQNALREELSNAGVEKHVSTIITQVEVSPEDAAFAKPTKPIGPFYSKQQAQAMMVKGISMMEDSGRGWRKVVPSPKPIKVIETETIECLVKHGEMVIACGGGGIPVIRVGNNLKGVEAVVDKDYASAKLATALNVDAFIVLTAVEKVAINFGKPDEQWLDEMTVAEAKALAKQGQFGKGSMEPKVLAAVEFLEANPGKMALITHLNKVKEALEGKTGTRII